MLASDTRVTLDRLDTDGYVVLERAVGDDTLRRIKDELDPYLGHDALHGRNDFEGFSTNRVYALLAKAPSVAELVEHVDVVAILDALLLPGFCCRRTWRSTCCPARRARACTSTTASTASPVPAADRGQRDLGDRRLHR